MFAIDKMFFHWFLMLHIQNIFFNFFFYSKNFTVFIVGPGILNLSNIKDASKLLVIGDKCVWKPAHAAVFTGEAIDHWQI